MKILLLTFSLQSLGSSDSWFSADKAQHFFLAAFIQGTAFSLARATGVAKDPSMFVASAVSASSIVAKELRDQNGRGSPSVKDAVWGLAGAAAISPVLLHTK